MKENNLLRMDNVGIVVESLDDAIAFFLELGLSLVGRTMVEGEWAGRITGLKEAKTNKRPFRFQSKVSPAGP